MLPRIGRRVAAGSARHFSAMATTSPTQQIANNVAILEAMASAENEAALTAAKGVTAEAVATAGGAAGSAPYKQDPTAWQNMAFGDFVLKETTRQDFMPFVIGGVVTYLLLGVALPAALPADGKKDSHYIKFIKGEHKGEH